MDYSTDINKGFRLISFYCRIEKYINLLDCSTILEILMKHYLISDQVIIKKITFKIILTYLGIQCDF